MNTDKFTLLRREGNVQANDSLQRQFTFHAKFQKCHVKFDAVSALSLVQGYSTFSSVQRTIVVYSYLERCLCVSRTLPLSLSNTAAVLSGCRLRPNFGRMTFGFFFCSFKFLCSCRVDSRLVTMSHFLWYSFQCRCVLRTVVHLSLLVSSISVHGSGRVILFTLSFV